MEIGITRCILESALFPPMRPGPAIGGLISELPPAGGLPVAEAPPDRRGGPARSTGAETLQPVRGCIYSGPAASEYV